jgi:hypothetical protein
MPISHLSYIHKPEGYTTPVDLNLLGRVLQFKQAQYDAGTAKVQSNLDNLASLDVVKDVDRDYLNTKLNNLVNTTNSIGGADYSDPNVTNQIAGLSSQIYGDDNVINAVANTKKFRYVQKYYQDLKEKKPKDWNPANEWYDVNKFSSWLQDGKVGTAPQEGSGRVTPYTKYEEDWQKMFDKIANSANVTTEITDKGLMYRLDTHKLVSPERIWETASKMLTPNQRQQLGIEGRYTYNGLPISELTKAYDSETYEKVGKAKGELEDYQTKYKGASSLEDQQKYEKLINEKNGEISTLLAPIKKNAEQIKENLYLNDKLKGLQARYSFNQSSSKIQANAGAMFTARENRANKEFEYRQRKDQVDQTISLLDKGLMWYDDPLTGQRTIVRDPSAPRKGSSSSSRNNGDANSGYDNDGLPTLSNSSEDQNNEFSSSVLNDRKEAIIGDNTKLFREFVQQFGRKKGLTDVIVTDLMDDGRLQTKVDPEIQKTAQEMMSTWEAMTRGEKINYDNLDPLFKSFVGRYQENLKEVEAIDKFTSGIDKQIKDEYGVNDQEFDLYNKWQQARTAQQEARSYGSTGSYGSTNMVKMAQAKADSVANATYQELGASAFQAPAGVDVNRINSYLKNRAGRKEDLIKSANVRFNLPAVTITDDKEKNLAKLIVNNGLTTQLFDDKGKAMGKAALNVDNIEPISKGYAYVQTDNGTKVSQPVISFKYKTGSDAEDFKIAQIILNPEQQRILQMGTDVKELKGYRLGLHVNGEVNGVNTTSGKDYDLKYDIVKYYPEKQNDETVFVRVQVGNNKVSLYNLPFPSLDQAIQFMETQTKYKSLDEAAKALSLVSK